MPKFQFLLYTYLFHFDKSGFNQRSRPLLAKTRAGLRRLGATLLCSLFHYLVFLCSPLCVLAEQTQGRGDEQREERRKHNKTKV